MARLRRWLTLDMVWLAAALSLLALRPLLSAVPPYDFWWHMATGRVIDTTGSVPRTEIFSWTMAGAPYYNQPWAAQWLMFKLHALGGLPLLLIIQALLICCSYGGLLWLGLRRLGDGRRLRRAVAALLLLIVPASFDNWSIRPQTYAVPLFVATLAIVTAYRLGWRNRLWLLPPILALWANIHGSFVLGLGLIGLAWLGELATRLLHPRRPELVRREGLDWRGLAVLAGWGAASGLATLLNPRGAGLLGYVGNLLSSPQVANLVTEWQPTYRTWYGVFFFLLLAATLWAMWRARPEVDLTDLLTLLPFIYLGVSAQRNVMWFALVAYMPLLCALAARAKPGSPLGTSPPFQGQPALNGVLMGFLGLLLVLSLPWVKIHLPLPPEGGNLISAETPVGAVPALRALPAAEQPRKLFTELGMGSYLTWAAPDYPVFIDPRFELYPLKLWNDYDAIIAVSQPELLDSYQIDGVLVSQKTEPELVSYLRGQAGWRELWTGDGLSEVGVLFVRR